MYLNNFQMNWDFLYNINSKIMKKEDEKELKMSLTWLINMRIGKCRTKLINIMTCLIRSNK